jgi:NTP pyrophosphatase (non-canonical NTP hydrolase)
MTTLTLDQLGKTVSELARRIFANNKHWRVDPRTGEAVPHDVPRRCMLLVSEAAEMFEAWRRGNPPDDHLPEYDGYATELADLLIRALDDAVANGIDDVGAVVVAKLMFNATRTDHTFAARLAANGKRC